MATESEVQLEIGAQLAHAEGALARAGSSTAGDDALALLSALLGEPAALLAAQTDGRLSPADAATYAGWIARRAAGEAIPHITGHLPFMGLDLLVGSNSPLVPAYGQRLVEVALELARQGETHDLVAAEIGTGCGAIALALAAFEPRFARIYAVDPSPDALRTAEANGARYLLNLVISWLSGAGLEAVPAAADLLIHGQCRQAHSLAVARMLRQAPGMLRPGGALIIGLDPGEGQAAGELLRRALPEAHIWATREAAGAIVIAQLPRRPSSGGAASDTQ